MSAAQSKSRVVTFGCRLNSYESEVMLGHAEKAGLANAIIFNSCAVTAEAVRGVRQAIRKTRRENPAARIIVTGCAAQIDPDMFANMPEVDLVLGNAEKLEARSFSPAVALGNERVRVNDIMSVRETAGHMVSTRENSFEGRVRAFVQIQNGCDHRCTFCIIPYGRGPSRSVAAGSVVSEIRGLVEEGYREVVLTGVDITSYGADLPGTPSLGNLAARILKLVPELPRLRISSIDPVEADPVLMRLIAEEERLMPHLHLSLQAGDDMILKRMKRRHLRADAIAFCREAQRLRPDMIFGADLIAGFPTETGEMFENSLRLVDECGLTWLHVFPFSPRAGTPAARMPQTDRAIGKARAERLRAKGAERVRAHLERTLGTAQTILMENGGIGRTRQFTPVRVADPRALPGSLIEVALTGHDGKSLEGRLAA
ncbi:MAG: tRNA (N(6)-L-threonylcarbamoyladenosine(37)-C(2))-methylthiotransferase MtaB [Parvibaculaceae bacterium]|nr:tRNA (N(6)-L-threonylcarbamoyladenosine(37)-C(2))-methylthiotransferase MtaB [Parvibaculaceae bacterium]